MSDRKMTRKERAVYYAECKEQATSREWSSFGDKRVEAFEAGWDAAIREAVEIIEGWKKAYPEDIFTPLPEYGSPEQEAQDNTLVTRASAHMGRHMSSKLIEQVQDLNKP